MSQALCLGNLVLAEVGLHLGQADFDIQSMLIVLGGGQGIPFVGLYVIPGHAFALFITQCKFVLGSGKSALSSSTNPFYAFFDASRHTGAFEVTEPDLVFGRSR